MTLKVLESKETQINHSKGLDQESNKSTEFNSSKDSKIGFLLSPDDPVMSENNSPEY
jgi:hypothetical protein